MKKWIGRLFRALIFGVLTATVVAVMRSQTGGEAEPISDLAVRALAYALGYFIADGLLARWLSRRRKITEAR